MYVLNVKGLNKKIMEQKANWKETKGLEVEIVSQEEDKETTEHVEGCQKVMKMIMRQKRTTQGLCFKEP